MSKTGDPPNPEGPPLDYSPEGPTATRRLLVERGEELRVIARKLAYGQKGRLLSQKKDQIEDLAMDLFQATAMKVLEKGDQYKPELPFEAWFFGWAVNELNHILQKQFGRSKKHKSVHFTDGAELSVPDHRGGGSAQDTFHDLHIREVTDIVLREVRNVLGEEDFGLFLDKFYHFKDNEELASDRNISKKNIAVKTTRIKQKVSQAFHPERGDELLDGADNSKKEGHTLRSGARS